RVHRVLHSFPTRRSSDLASVSYINDAFVCFTCGVKGDAFKLIMREEGISYTKALEHAERLSPGSSSEVPRKPGRKSGRRAFGEARHDGGGTTKGGRVPPRVRGRPTPWT